MSIITQGEMRAIREGQGKPVKGNKKLPVKPKSEREQLFDSLKKKGIEYKKNVSNEALRDLLKESE